jgi:molybdenum cofactor cytidylyltransferase
MTERPTAGSTAGASGTSGGAAQKPDAGTAVPLAVSLSGMAEEITLSSHGARLSPLSHAPATFRFGAVILAAGPSTRMGAPKQLLELEGQPLLVHAVNAALASPAWPVVVVLGANAEKIRPVLAQLPVLVTENAAWAEGMAASLRAGVTTLQQFSRRLDAALIALCDQPAFSAATIVQLITAQRTTGKSIVASRYAGRNGAPALFLREHFPTLTALTGEEGARALLNDHPERVATVDLPALALDLDTPADVAALKRPAGT